MTRGRKPGGPKTGGRKPGVKNRLTVEREAKARLDQERLREVDRLRAEGAKAEVAAAQTAGVKLMKEIAFDFARLFAGLAAFYQPYPQWSPQRDSAGNPVIGKNGRPVMINANPNFDEAKFREYAVLAKDTALGAASYESPKLSAVMVGSAVVNEIEIIGGLPDDQDGGFMVATDALQIEGSVQESSTDDAAAVPRPVPKAVND